jgi:diguanylate cyclase (GGDEF)-like protein
LLVRLAAVLGLAAAYFITGKLGLLLAIPPGYATAVWLPSGIALAGILIFGYRTWLGVLLGSLCVNVGVSFDASSTAAILKSLVVAASIGAGATLQALAGAYLVRRFVGFPSALDDERDVGRFLILGGPLSSLVNATWSVTTLLVAGVVSADSYLFNWFTWWVGDSIGILIVTPLVLAWAGEPRDGWRRRRITVTVPLCAAFVIAAAFFIRASAWEQERIRNEFVQRAESIGDALKRSLGHHLEVLESIGDFRAGSPSFGWPEFRAFVAGPLGRYPGLRAVSWNPRVPDRDRAEHEAALKRDGFADAGITERNAEGQLVPAARRSEHIFVRYIEPHHQNRPALGYDVASDPTRRDALDRARDSGIPVATARIHLVQDVRREPGFLVFLPVYRDRDAGDTLEERRAALVGYMTGVFRVADLVASSVKNVDSEEIEVALRDTAAADSEQLLYSNQRPRHEDAGAGLMPGRKGIVHEVVIDVAGRRWILTASPTSRYLDAHRGWQAWTVLAAGLLFTGLLGAFLLVITGRTTRVEQLAGRVTRLNRVYAVLSGINAAIVHIRDRQELFREVCRISIDSGRFRMVWFGLLDKEGERLVPLASAGDVRGFFDAASTAVTHAKPGGVGLTGRAIREMKPMVSNDIQNDPQRTMKDEFRERGINALAVLPLIVGNEAVGVVNLYAADVGFFDEEEMRLLRELAGDISFALDNIDKQEKLRRLTRVNEMLSSINGAIVRIRDRLELYQEACRIAVETGGLRFAWLCVVEEDEMRLQPVASAGADDRYLDLIRGRLSLRDDAPEGHGVAAKAVREKRALVVNDAQSDPKVLFKKEHAARGIRSMAVLPLSVGGKVVGTFGLHSGEVGFFDDHEMKLISEIAGNIAFALDHMEKEEKVERLNRVYAVLSGINGMIVRVRDRDELFREACRIAIELGQFRLVYIGMVDDAQQQIRPVAWAGDHPELAQRLRPLGPSAAGREGTASQAVRLKRPSVENNITAESRTLTYPEEVLKHGYRSVASFPLVVGEKAVGVVGLFAAEPGYFDAEEVKLLQELAGDIAFALEHIEKEEKLDYLAYYDSITGLANRTLFHERLDQYVRQASRAQRRLAVLVVDIERFRTINDTLGRPAGDALLKQMGARFLDLVAEPGEVARLGADHFAVVIPDVKLEADLVRIIEKARERILGKPFSVAGAELRMGTKAGIALFPNDGADAETLLRNAEAALQKAKASGERHVFYTQEMTARVSEKLALENKLRQAVEKSEFVLHYQPKVDLETRAIVGVEALIRWQSPELGLVPPGKFISLLEETGLILDVGSWALTRAALDHRAWVEAGLKPPRVAVNVSAIQLRQRDFVNIVEQAVMEGMAPVAIDLEITESLIMENVEATIEKLKNLQALGIRTAIDDFGTGYSSLAYLAKLPVETVKIDRSFVITMLDDPDTATLVQTMITLAHSLKLTVVAEGVDSEEQAKVLRLLRCDQMQGYLFSKPLPVDALVELLRKSFPGASH